MSQITDDEFRLQMDNQLKAQGLRKAERNRIVEEALLRVGVNYRKKRIENERSLAVERRKGSM
jgi:ABC-type taurine transport system ATPase subunit